MKKVFSFVLSLILLFGLVNTTNNIYARTSIKSSEVASYMNGLVGQTNEYKGYCLLFVTKCWENMGFAGSYGWGTAANFAAHNTVSTSKDNIPVGADVFFTSPDGNGHIGIHVGNGYFVHAGGNSTYEKNSISEAYYSARYTGWGWHPNVVVEDDFGGGSLNPTISDNKNYVIVGEDITFLYSGLTECSKVEYYFEKGGSVYYTKDSTQSREYSTYFENEGLYQVYVGGYYNGNWYYSSKITVYVFNPSFTSDKTNVKPKEKITFTYSGFKECDGVYVCFEKNGKVYYSADSTTSRTHVNYFDKPGTYYVYAKGTKNDYSVISNKIKITVTCAHDFKLTNTKSATCTTEGSKKYTCTICGETKTETIKATGHSYDSGKITSTTATTYTKTFTCSKCKNTYTKKYNKKANTLTVSGKTATVKYANLKKKNQTVALKNAIAVSKAKGTVTFAKASGNSKITIIKTSGNITVKKGLKKGTYKVKIKVTAAGTKEYKSLSKTVTVTIKVK